MTSLAHGLGEKGHRTGQELPAMVAPVFAKGDDGRIYPNRAMWPAYWGYLRDGKIIPVPPNQAYEITRRALRVRSSFLDEILKPSVSSRQLKELLGDERASDTENWTTEEQAKVDAAQAEQGRVNFNEKIHAALQAIESDQRVDSAVFVSSGKVYARGESEGTLKTLDIDEPQATTMVQWPMAHNVRPAGWALGAGGCTDCHSDAGHIFTSTVAAIGPSPDQGEPISMARLQGVDLGQQLQWNELFQSRAIFKYLVGGSVALLFLTVCIGMGAFASRLAGRMT